MALTLKLILRLVKCSEADDDEESLWKLAKARDVAQDGRARTLLITGLSYCVVTIHDLDQ